MEEVKEELNKGWKTAHELRDLLEAKEEYNNNNNNNNNNEALISMKQHSAMIIQTFDNAISILKTAQPMDPSGSRYNNTRSSKTQDVTINTTTALTDQDAYSWRKYGQKPIVHAKHPREYYRCANKDQGCRATKQVQIISDNPTQYKITYQSKHSCNNKGFLTNASELDILETLEPDSANMLSFKSSNEPSVSKQTIFKEDSSMLHHDGSNSMGHLVPMEPVFTGQGSWSGPIVSPNIDFGFLVDNSGQLDDGFEDLRLWD